MSSDDHLDALVHSADLDGLVRMIDDRTSGRDWDGLLRVRDRSRSAVETGRQLWPAATLAEFRLALLAPAPFVAAVLDETDGNSGRFTIGPLTEVAAQHHTWEELAPHLDRSPRAAFVAHERAIRGETIPERDAATLPPVLDIPVEIQSWEPDYPVATYNDVGAEFPAPTFLDSTEALTEIGRAPGARTQDGDEVRMAVESLIEPWTSSSNGRVEVVEVVEGTAADAISALGAPRVRVREIGSSDALAWVAWAGASGGAHGRRRGAAAGRFGAWWLLAAIGDSLDVFPPSTNEIEELLADLRWYRWDAFEPASGWTLQLAIEDPSEAIAWAIVARDAA